MKTKLMSILIFYLLMVDKPARLNVIKDSVYYKPNTEILTK